MITVFQELELHDTLIFTLTKKRDVEILTNVKSLQNRQNLICRIAFFIQETYNVESGAVVQLEKRIPVAAGLGGGSSNAAATILALSELWSLNLTHKEMHEIAAKFGSDINFFLVGGTALGTGRGEVIEPMPDREEETILLVNPRFDVSSAEAYKLYARKGIVKDRSLVIAEMKEGLREHRCFNALEAGIRETYPEIDSILNRMNEAGVPSMLSGSGPTCIGFCKSSDKAGLLASSFEKDGFWTCLTKTRNRTKAV